MTEHIGCFDGTLVCPVGHEYPAAAGVCPEHTPVAASAAPAVTVPGLAAVPAIARAFVDQFVEFMDNGKAPRHAQAFGYENHKIGIVNHIPVTDTLAKLTAYFNGGAAQGSTHAGFGRERHGWLEVAGLRIPCGLVHQYMPLVGPVAPWAQGIRQTSPACPATPASIIRGLSSGALNGAFVSKEHVAMRGSDGLTDAQFNSSVLWDVYCAAYFGFAIGVETVIGHDRIDQRDRCFDPGWSPTLWNDLLAAGRGVLAGDFSGLRGVERSAPPVPPEPEPPVDDRLVRYRDALTVQAADLDERAGALEVHAYALREQAKNLREVLR